MRRVLLTVWWLAVLSHSGELIIMEYTEQRTCNVIRRAYASVGLKTTHCMQKGGGNSGKESATQGRQQS